MSPHSVLGDWELGWRLGTGQVCGVSHAVAIARARHTSPIIVTGRARVYVAPDGGIWGLWSGALLLTPV